MNAKVLKICFNGFCWLGMLAVALGAGYVSYEQIHALSLYVGTTPEVAAVFPVTFDLGAVVASVKSRMADTTPRGKRWCTAVFAACLALSAMSNVASDILVAHMNPVAAIFMTWPVVLLFGLDRIMVNTTTMAEAGKRTPVKRTPRKATAPSTKAPAKPRRANATTSRNRAVKAPETAVGGSVAVTPATGTPHAIPTQQRRVLGAPVTVAHLAQRN